MVPAVGAVLPSLECSGMLIPRSSMAPAPRAIPSRVTRLPHVGNTTDGTRTPLGLGQCNLRIGQVEYHHIQSLLKRGIRGILQDQTPDLGHRVLGFRHLLAENSDRIHFVEVSSVCEACVFKRVCVVVLLFYTLVTVMDIPTSYYFHFFYPYTNNTK